MKDYQFYHIYPLGMLKERRIKDLKAYTEHLKTLNINAIYLGPVFYSVSHGYDTIDYLQVDPRLGTNEDLYDYVAHCHSHGIDIILDCVFNHVSREFFAFKDVLINGSTSSYKDWFFIDFGSNSSYQDGFSYKNWDGHDSLVKLNLQNPSVRAYLIDTARCWIRWFNIDGIRLDAADVMDRSFLRELNDTLKQESPDFFILAEMVHGDYYKMITEIGITSVTNYECYKGLYSSLNDKNYFEIAYSFKRLFETYDTCIADLQDGRPMLYNFCDNHDVNRIASVLNQERLLYPLYIMLYTMPGYTSLYYQSEFGKKGIRSSWSDEALRQPFYTNEIEPEHAIYRLLKRLSQVRKEHHVLFGGTYKQLILTHECIGYVREDKNEKIVILINSSDTVRTLSTEECKNVEKVIGKTGYDLLDGQQVSPESIILYPNWGCLLTAR